MKVMLAGYEGCGKSNIMNRYVDDTFTEQYIATIGVDFKTKTI